MEHYNFIDLFCGAGGLSVGLEMAGFHCVYANDVDVNSVKTIKANHPQAHATCEPIEFLTEEKIKEYIGDKKIHLVAGGPPCQGFSTIGKGNPQDRRNSLFNHFLRIVKILQPQFVLFENVTGLLATKNEFVLKSIIESFQEIGYTLNIKVLESQHYGVPQKRKRTILVGGKKGKFFSFPLPEFDTTLQGSYLPPRTLGGALHELQYYLENHNPEDDLHCLQQVKIKKDIDLERIKCIPEGGRIRYREDEEKYLPPSLKLKIDWSTIREGRLRENQYHRLERNRPAPTLNTQNHHYYHPTENRKFTLRELAMMQSFPPNYIFKGKFQSVVKQIGNAVPPLMAKAVGKALYHALSFNQFESNLESSDIKEVRSKAFIYQAKKKKLVANL